ncbi:MAG: CdaR family protein [bacterium]|nr:CdaR family protein [bacterium]
MIRDWLRQIDFGLLIISLLVALALWLNVKNERIETRHYYPFIELKNKPANLAIKSQYPKNLDVVIQGQATILDRIQPDLISVSVDVSGLSPGKKTFRLSIARNVVLPKVFQNRVEVVRIIPETLEIETELIDNTVNGRK